MERRYHRQYENYENMVPDLGSLQLPEGTSTVDGEVIKKDVEVSSIKSSFKLDDLILIGILVMLLNEEEKDTSTIILLALLFLSDYIF